MTKTRTFVDANVLIWAARGDHDLSDAAMVILDDPNRVFIASDFLRLEVLPIAVYTNHNAEAEFYRAFFDDENTTLIMSSEEMVAEAQTEAEAVGLSALDALHITAAKRGGATEFVTGEKTSKPMFRVTGITVTSIRPNSAS